MHWTDNHADATGSLAAPQIKSGLRFLAGLSRTVAKIGALSPLSSATDEVAVFSGLQPARAQSLAETPPNPRPSTPIGDASPRVELTVLLRDVASGKEGADTQLLEAVYAQLHGLARQKMAGERSGHTLGATGLVHEVYAKIFAADSAAPEFQDRAHFFRTAAQAMRRVLIDYARARCGAKRGGDGSWTRVSLEGIDLAKDEDLDALLSIDEAICRLEAEDERAASVVRLRFYAGLELDAVAGLLNLTVRSVSRDWSFARAWLAKDLMDHSDSDRFRRSSDPGTDDRTDAQDGRK